MRTAPKLSVGLSKKQAGERRPEANMSAPHGFRETVAGRGTLSINTESEGQCIWSRGNEEGGRGRKGGEVGRHTQIM